MGCGAGDEAAAAPCRAAAAGVGGMVARSPMSRHENGLADWAEIYLEVLADGGPAKAVGPGPVRNPTS